ncbi:MAG: tetratricopeptide repeat protein [Gemmatimonadetes bacterium]|nr:tetratricopeptide repeat protein [Gemmatimonadota bacterium]
MRGSLIELGAVRRLAETGHHAAVVEALEHRPRDELERSATLALLYGTAQARLGHHADGERWVEVALERARERGDRAIEARALNVRGGIALEAGRIEEAARFLMRALAVAEQEGDHATAGRCSNNLGIITNLRGEHDRAVGLYTLAIAAFQRAGWKRGVAETQGNLAISHRDRGEVLSALKAADRAVQEAQAVGDLALSAQTLAGRAEIRLAAGEPQLALREVTRALKTHGDVQDQVGEAEAGRILALALAATGDARGAEHQLLTVIERAQALDRPLLVAAAESDLAFLLQRLGRTAEARDVAGRARARYQQVGAVAEVRKLDRLLLDLPVENR